MSRDSGPRSTPPGSLNAAPHPQSPDECWCDECEASFATDPAERSREIRALRAIVDSADRFARFDPGVDWPSENHIDPVDAICAAFDAIREALAVEVDR